MSRAIAARRDGRGRVRGRRRGSDAAARHRRGRGDRRHFPSARSSSSTRTRTKPRRVVFKRGDEYDTRHSRASRRLLRDHRNGETPRHGPAAVRPAPRSGAGREARAALRNHLRLPLAGEQRQDVGAAGQRRRQEIAAHAGARARRAPQGLSDAQTCAISRWRRSRAAWVTTSARISCISTPGAFRTWSGS